VKVFLSITAKTLPWILLDDRKKVKKIFTK
jgi:hypothetical protein